MSSTENQNDLIEMISTDHNQLKDYIYSMTCFIDQYKWFYDNKSSKYYSDEDYFSTAFDYASQDEEWLNCCYDDYKLKCSNIMEEYNVFPIRSNIYFSDAVAHLLNRMANGNTKKQDPNDLKNIPYQFSQLIFYVVKTNKGASLDINSDDTYPIEQINKWIKDELITVYLNAKIFLPDMEEDDIFEKWNKDEINVIHSSSYASNADFDYIFGDHSEDYQKGWYLRHKPFMKFFRTYGQKYIDICNNAQQALRLLKSSWDILTQVEKNVRNQPNCDFFLFPIAEYKHKYDISFAQKNETPIR